MHSKDTSSTSQPGHIDLYAFFGALHRDKIDRDAPSEGFSRAPIEDYDDLSDFTHYSAIGKEPQPDHPPEDSEINVGAINPYALVEAVLGHKLDHSSTNVARVVSDYWPALYEKAFAMWITRSDSDRPDITQTAHGDPIKAMAQIDGREPQYYITENHDDVIGLVRYYSVNFKTISPMCAFTYASGNMFCGSNLVANHAYSVLGWSNYGDRQYIIVRNPWGVTEPRGLTSYPGLIDRVEPSFWPPASLLDGEGVLAIEAHDFREYFACIGRTK
ncbi:putative Calpain catalytic domain-containing protein [Seiridium unicorne]|uniref:Calpain catalytic domain-containing protein n=1 Tax=Seiridium unicorne TaxID=138068 RepID=A0ABR2VD93_9PEZI